MSYPNYLSAVFLGSPAAPKGEFAPFEAVVVEQKAGAFCANVLSSQGQVLYDGHRRWSERHLAQAEANFMRTRLLLKFKRDGEEPLP